MTIPSQPIYEVSDEIDLRQYLDLLIRWRYELLVLPVLFTLVAFIWSFGQTPVYEATALIAPIQNRSEVSLEPKFVSINEESEFTNRSLRLKSFAQQVKNPEIAQIILEQYQDKLIEEGYLSPSISQLLGMIEGQLGQESELIEIKVTATQSDLAVHIANSWGEQFTAHINRTYGQDDTSLEAISEQLAEAQTTFQDAQQQLSIFVATEDQTDALQRRIIDREAIITNLQNGKQTAVSAMVEYQVEVQTRLINSYLDADAANRELLFNKGQESKRAILTKWLDFERESRLSALELDRNLRQSIFEQFTTTESNSKLAVFSQQAEQKLQDYEDAYERKSQIQKFLSDTQTLLRQVEQGGDDAAQSNILAIQLLKAQIFASGGGDLSSNVQLQLPAIEATTASQQQADLTALADVLSVQVTNIDTQLADLSTELLQGTGYDYLDELDPEVWVLTRPTSSTTTTGDETLADNILERYDSLYKIGQFAYLSQEINDETELFNAIEQLYPTLFEEDSLMALVNSVPEDTELAQIGQQVSEQLLNFDGIDTLIGEGGTQDPLDTKIEKLEQEVRNLQAEVSVLESKRLSLQQARDLAWEAYSTLATKETELKVASRTPNSEVRFAVPAATPDIALSRNTVRNSLIAATVGFLFSILIVFFLDYTGQRPYFIGRDRAKQQNIKHSPLNQSL